VVIGPDLQDRDVVDDGELPLIAFSVLESSFYAVVLQLNIIYPEAYPHDMPEFAVAPLQGNLNNQESVQLLDSIRTLVCTDSSLLFIYLFHNQGGTKSG
jgi:hypothetical protein